MPETVTKTTPDMDMDPRKESVAATKAMVEAQKAATATFTRRPGADLRAPAKLWHETDNFDGQAAKALVLVLRTRGCEWLHKSGCTMCGYFGDSHMLEVASDDIVAQFEHAIEHEFDDHEVIKIYTSGSFFDEKEVPAPARRHILERVGALTGKMSTEDQPQLLTPELVSEATSLVERFEVGFGMESAHDDVLAHSVNKAFRFRQYEAGARLLHEHGGIVKTYLVQKPPFLTEAEAMEDTLASIRKVAPHSDVVSVNPVNVQRHTLVADLFRHRAYRPPWLWSVAHVVLEASRDLPDGVTLKCHPVGGGHARGAHNCGKCDKHHMKALEDYTLGRGTKRLERLFESPPCGCIERWRFELETEGLLGASSWTDPREW